LKKSYSKIERTSEVEGEAPLPKKKKTLLHKGGNKQQFGGGKLLTSRMRMYIHHPTGENTILKGKRHNLEYLIIKRVGAIRNHTGGKRKGISSEGAYFSSGERITYQKRTLVKEKSRTWSTHLGRIHIKEE